MALWMSLASGLFWQFLGDAGPVSSGPPSFMGSISVPAIKVAIQNRQAFDDRPAGGRRHDLQPSPAARVGKDRSCMLWLDREGQILDCWDQVRELFGYCREELEGRHISLLLPTFADTDLLHAGAINPYLAFLCRCGTTFLAVGQDGREVSCTLFLNLVSLRRETALALIIRLGPQAAEAGWGQKNSAPPL